MLRWSSVAPFDTPVVPPVYCRKATSSAFTWTGLKVRAPPSFMTALNVTWPGSDQAGTIFFTRRTTRLTIVPFTVPSMSPIEATMMCLTLVFATQDCSVAAKFSRMTIASAPESFSWCSSSRGV